MKKIQLSRTHDVTLFGATGVVALIASLGAVSPAHAVDSVAPPTAVVAKTAAEQSTAMARSRFTTKQRWAREVTRYGDQDTSTSHIEHVRELQYRLRWAGVYRGPVTGYFGTLTRAAVKRYQKREPGVRVTAVAGHLTWKHLIHDTVRRRGAIPHSCKKAGWHACYDRSVHQVTLWHGGRIHNSWLVRGGESDTPTRLGNSRVYYRDIDHVSGLPGADGSPMPYSQFFDGGQAYHGSAFMIDPFSGHSHGCINMYIEDARQLWKLTSSKKLHVSVYGAWS